ncbi:MAG TPA: glycosyltransferase family 2 protein, partial [Herbaspirillum sp.]|nr:glycosyltransferase family 2 protein [Herbaspirillum sp.]
RQRAERLLARLQPDFDAAAAAPVAGRVSVLLPYAVFASFGTGDDEAQQGVFAMLEAQSHQDWECIAVHDGSQLQMHGLTVALQKLTTPWKIQLLESDAINLAESLNAAARNADGAFLLALDRPLQLQAGQLEQAVALLQQQPALDIAAFVHPSETDFFQKAELPTAPFMSVNRITGCAIFRQKIWEAASRFNPVFDGSDILWDFWIHAIKRGARVAALPDAGTAPVSAAPASPMTLALLAFANAGCVTIDRLTEAMQFIIAEMPGWRAANQVLLDRCCGYTTAIALGYLVRGNEAAPAKPAALHPPAPVGEQYVRWILARRLPAAQRAAFIEATRQWPQRPRLVAVVLDLHDDRPMLLRTLRSLQAQVYAPERIVVLSPGHSAPDDARIQWLVLQDAWADALNRALPKIACDWFYLLHAGDSLEPDALLMLADTVHLYPDLAYVYTDEDTMDGNGSVADPVCKPAINLDLLRCMPYVGRSAALSHAAFVALGGFSPGMGDIAPVDFLFRVIEELNFGAIAHLNQVLCHAGLPFANWRAREDVVAHMQQAIAGHLVRLGIDAEVMPQAGGLQRVSYRHAARPPVSILIRADGALADLQRCVQNVLSKTAYADFELLILAADESCRDAVRINLWLQKSLAGEARVRLLPAAGLQRAGALNQAVQQASGEYLVFLGHAAAVLQTEWLDLLLNHAQRGEVGMVGVKLIDRHKRIAHAGAVAGLDGAVGAVFVGEPFDSPAYQGRLQADQNYAMLSGDCMMVRRAAFDGVGGFDERYGNFELASADLCLRIRQAGYIAVWTPHAVLLREDNALISGLQHVGRDAERNMFYRRWWQIVANDPGYNVNLSVHGKGFAIEPAIALISNTVMALRRPRILVLSNVPDPAAAPELSPYLALERAALAEVTVAAELPPLSDLARMELDSVVLHGALDAARMSVLRLLRSATPLRLVHAPSEAPDALQAALLRATPDYADRVVVGNPALAAIYSSFQVSVTVLDTYAPVVDTAVAGVADNRRLAAAPGARIRVGFDGDADAATLARMAQLFAQIGDAVTLVVWAYCYPLALQPYIAEFHQISSFGQAAEGLSPSSLNLDLAVVPDQDDSVRRLLRVMSFGAAAIPVIGMAGAIGDLPIRSVEWDIAQWVAAIREYVAQPALLVECGALLQRAVLARNALNSERLSRLRDALV